MLDVNGTRLYITGDPTYSDDLITITDMKPDLMMTCINRRLGCMNIPDAARLTAHIQPKYAVPMHIGMFKENTANPKEFVIGIFLIKMKVSQQVKVGGKHKRGK